MIHRLFVTFGLAVGNLYASQQTNASWYGEEHRGDIMANGKPFVPENSTCASWDYPLGTRLAVLYGVHSVVVTVTDRGPAKRLVKQGRRLDLSIGAWVRLRADPDKGILSVTIFRLR